MQVKIRNEVVKKIGKQKLKIFLKRDSQDYFRYYSDLYIDLKDYDKDVISYLKGELAKVKDVRGAKTSIRDINTWVALKEKKIRIVKRVRDFESVLQQYLLDVYGHWVFRRDRYNSDSVLAYRVVDIHYHPKEQHQYSTTPEHVEVRLIYKRYGIERETQLSFWAEDIINKTPFDSLQRLGYEPATEELVEIYNNSKKKYIEIKDRIGKQYLALGGGEDDTLDDEDEDRRYYSRHRKGKNFVFDNNRVVIDVMLENEAEYEKLKDTNRVELGQFFWSNIAGDLKSDEDDDYENVDELEYSKKEVNVEIPTHPHVVVFDLTRHLRLSTHVDFLTEYVYDNTLSDKLILDPQVKELINTLVKHDSVKFKDIIQGKSGGRVILLSGKAGIGKTLTAEVFAEHQNKPLYNVQASQLGLNPNDLEEELKKVISRSARWDSILLIDEADVYIHERGNDLNQNAIVGVFLRVLEYHDSTLFFTTNRPDIVDDAIISRCIAKIDYQHPTPEQQRQIWDVIKQMAKLDIEKEEIDKFVKTHNKYSGRDIKNMLKLANLKSKADGIRIDSEMLHFIAKFNPSLSNEEKKD